MKIVSKKSFLPVLFVGNFLVSVLLAGLVLSQQAFAADDVEQESNQPIAMAQFITPGMDEYEVTAVIGNLSGSVVDDVDFFKFYGQAGDVVTFDIDGGYRGGARSVDTEMAVFGEGPTFKRWRANDDGGVRDPGSNSSWDPRILNFTLPTTGVYYVAVGHTNKRFVTGGNVYGTTGGNGDYTLVVSGVSGGPQVLHINIDVKPGSDPEKLSPLNPKSKGRVPVALLSAENFDPADVDVSSLTFGHDGDEDSLAKCNKGSADFNKDGVKELVCLFDNRVASFRKGDVEGVLRGKLKDGTLIEGRGLLKVVGEKAN